MAFNRCNKDFMGYCNGQPEWEVEPIKRTANNVELTSGGTCKTRAKRLRQVQQLSSRAKGD